MGGAPDVAPAAPTPASEAPASSFGFLGGGGETTPAPAAVAPASSSGVSSAFGFLDSNDAAGVAAAVPDAVGNGGVTGMDAFPAPEVSNGMPAAPHFPASGATGGELPVPELKQHESTLESLEQQCANIQTVVYQFEEVRNQFLAAKAQLAQLNGDLERLQNVGIDAVVIQTLAPEVQADARVERKVLTQRVSYLFEQISITADYMSKLTV
jgi:hypothetical protein